MKKDDFENITINRLNLNLDNYDSYKFKINLNRIAFIFIVIFIIIILYSTRIIYLSSKTFEKKDYISNQINRADITDRNGNFISKSVFTTNVGIDPKLVKDKKKLLIKLQYTFPEKNIIKIKEKLYGKKFFYIDKKVTPERFKKIKLLGEKSIRLEPKITRIYPDKNLFSHIIGQIDDDNLGISGIEKSLDEKLKDGRKQLVLTVDKELQFIIRNELLEAQKIFKNIGGAGILMNVNNGEILSLVSIPDFNLNRRGNLSNKKFINRATKGVYELGSVFKTFTIAAGFNYDLISPTDMFMNLGKKMKCGGRIISEYDENLPKDLSVEDILVHSSNIGSVKIGQLIGKEKMREFLGLIGMLDKIKFDIEEVGNPLPFKWRDCKLKTVSYGHGITTTPIQLARGYAILSNGGYQVNPTLIKKKFDDSIRKKILNDETSIKINSILRKVVTNGTATLSDVEGFEVGGKTGTAQIVENGLYTNKKINTFASVFPISDPKYVLVILLEDTKLSKDYIYKYRNKTGSFKGTPFNTAGWTSVEIAGKIIDKIGPILATKY
tara:strand:+ start:2176 stop:3831 length:1656 start_codon:yes stop_codon:yes gene_type:complete